MATVPHIVVSWLSPRYLGGAMITFIGSKKGYVHLLPGATIDSFLESESGRKADLPFTIQLDSFRIAYYPGTEAPADYISYITYSLPGQKNVLLHEQISMNRIFTSQGFRFYQSSFDDDGKGSWLTVNYDPWGTGVTYAGYILLGLSMIWLLFSRSSDFRRLLNHPLLKKGGVFILFIFCLAGNMQAQKKTPSCIETNTSGQFSTGTGYLSRPGSTFQHISP
ncbi:cytochrome c biogenesis protein ResB [Bacteroides ovatus]|nr:cytochrome c biogenesis protein ResB [Bacteroides ovatus]